MSRPAPRPPSRPVAGLPFVAGREGVRVAVRVAAKSAPAGVAGIRLDAAGDAYLQVRVNAAPEGGKANAALLKLLAREWGVAGSRLAIVAGPRGRRKTVHLAGDPPTVLNQLGEWIERFK